MDHAKAGDGVLQELTLFGEVDKVQVAIGRLRQFEPAEGYYLAFSGGKDSQTVYHLAQMAGVKFDAHYNLTTVDPPELVRFIKAQYPDVQVHRPTETMWELIVSEGVPPTRLMRYCCKELKEAGGSGRVVLTGVRWQESSRRSKRRMTEACLMDSTRIYVHPIIDWSASEVWEFLNEVAKAPHCCLYDQGFTRLGCIGCPMGRAKQMERQFRRWPKFYESYLRAFDRMLKHRVGRGLSTQWETAEAVMRWWIHGKDKVKGTDQTVMFE